MLTEWAGEGSEKQGERERDGGGGEGTKYVRVDLSGLLSYYIPPSERTATRIRGPKQKTLTDKSNCLTGE